MGPTSQHLIRIAVVGPESSGKTTLCHALAGHFNGMMVQEYAREYVTNLGRKYTFDDLEIIARKQQEIEQKKNSEALAQQKKFLFCDTELVAMKVWSEYCYRHTADWIQAEIPRMSYHLYLLLAPDLPWEPDPLRENAHDRDVLFRMFEHELKRYQKKYCLIRGLGDERTQAAVQAILPLLA